MWGSDHKCMVHDLSISSGRWPFNSVKPLNDADRMVNHVDHDQEQPDVGRYCLLKPVCLKTWENYDNLVIIIQELLSEAFYIANVFVAKNFKIRSMLREIT